jgi:hypothetical protein
VNTLSPDSPSRLYGYFQHPVKPFAKELVPLSDLIE